MVVKILENCSKNSFNTETTGYFIRGRSANKGEMTAQGWILLVFEHFQTWLQDLVYHGFELQAEIWAQLSLTFALLQSFTFGSNAGLGVFQLFPAILSENLSSGHLFCVLLFQTMTQSKALWISILRAYCYCLERCLFTQLKKPSTFSKSTWCEEHFSFKRWAHVTLTFLSVIYSV